MLAFPDTPLVISLQHLIHPLTIYIHAYTKVTMPTTEICITITGVRKPGLNETDFHHYITTHHAPLALPFLRKYGIKEYNLVDSFTACRPIAEELQMSKKLADYDYIVQFVMEDIAAFKALWEDEEFRANVKPDHKNFADETNSGISIGYRTKFI
ncbi:EthD domain-containing protein [Aspergillus karnatakaensis]|uniref:EthD domain-containing protein n=1 Tax=Aspergillus karnatakaensis TaxID=1810916 RepID=UPI003CCD0B13